jgi:hypothetical protein
MQSTHNAALISLNAGWLEDALKLVGRLDDSAFATAPPGLPGQRAGSHLRHILEFYECLFAGLGRGRIDYDARKRDETVENNRRAAGERIRLLVRQLETDARLRRDTNLLVRAEAPGAGTEQAAWLPSTISRELQTLSSHTIHHFALISVILRLHGFHVDANFGMSPSTLAFHAARAEEAA